MGNARNVPDQVHAADERWKDQEVLRFQSYMRLALNHSLGRNGRAVEALCYVSLMHNAKLVAPRSATVTRAEFQNYRAGEGNQAAHSLPGQLKIGGQRPSFYVRDPATKKRLDCIFGDVETLPANFNKADSEAEAKGLCAAFAAAVERVLERPRGVAGRIDRAAVRDAYTQVWEPKARSAFQLALLNKGEKFTMQDLQYGEPGGADYNTIVNLDVRESADRYQHDITQQRHILEKYLEAMSTRPRQLDDAAMDELERAFRT